MVDSELCDKCISVREWLLSDQRMEVGGTETCGVIFLYVFYNLVVLQGVQSGNYGVLQRDDHIRVVQ
jgi:hypothetical protein